MRCRYCQQRIPLLRKLTDTEFCSDEHRLLFLAEQEKLALARLVEAQQRFAQEALQAARAARHRGEATAPAASFLCEGPWPQFLPPRPVGNIEAAPLTPALSMPRLESSEVGALSRKPSPLTRPRAAAALGRMSNLTRGFEVKLEPLTEAVSSPAPLLPVRRARLARVAGPGSGLVTNLAPGFLAQHTEAPLGMNLQPHWGESVCFALRLNHRWGPGELPQAGTTAIFLAPACVGVIPKQQWVSGLPAQIRICLPRCGAAMKPDGTSLVKLEASQADLGAIPLAPVVVPVVEPEPATPETWRGDATGLPCALDIRLPGAALAGPRPVGLLGAESLAGLPAPLAVEATGGLAFSDGLSARLPQGKPHLPHRLAAIHAELGAASLDVSPIPLSAVDPPVIPSPASLESTVRVSTAVPPHLESTKPQPGWAPTAELFSLSEPPVESVFSSVAKPALDASSVIAAAVRVPRGTHRAAGGEFGFGDQLRSLTVDFIPQKGECRLEGVGALADWECRRPSPPALRVTPAAPAAIDGENAGSSIAWCAAGLSAFRSFWHHAPTNVRWLAVAAPLVFGLLWYSASGGRVATAQASGAFAESTRTARMLPAVTQFVSAGFSAARQSIAERAGVELFDDFRSGLSAWEGRGNWAQSWSYDNAGFVRAGALGLFTPSLGMSDYDLEFLGRIEKKALSWVVRAQDANNYYAFKLLITRPGPLPSVALVRYAVLQGKEGPRTQVPIPLVLRNDTLFRVRTIVRGSSLTTTVQGVVVDTWSDDRLSKGGIGFFSSKGEQSLFRWVTVTHQYDTVGKLCAFLAPFSIQTKKGD